MRVLALLGLFLLTLPEFNPKPVDRLRSPNKQYLAEVDGLRKLLFVTKKGVVKVNLHGHYDGLDIGRGICHLSWSPDSRYLAFDFVINNSARLPMEGNSFVGIIDMKLKEIWLLLPTRGCQPRFVNAKTLEFLSFAEQLNGQKGTPAYMTEGITLYRHSLKEWQPSDPGYVFTSGQKIDFFNDFLFK